MSTLQRVIAGGVAGLALMLSAGAALAYPSSTGPSFQSPFHHWQGDHGRPPHVAQWGNPGSSGHSWGNGSGHNGRRVVPLDIGDNHRRG
jgi:hypothetical protein